MDIDDLIYVYMDIDGFTNTYIHGYIVDAHISYFLFC